MMLLLFLSNALDAKNHGGVPTSDAVAGLAYYLSGHDYLDVPGLDVSPRFFPRLTFGAWVKVRPLMLTMNQGSENVSGATSAKC